MFDAFISYSNADAEWAMRLYQRLRRYRLDGRSLNVFFAPEMIAAGQSIPLALSNALDDSSHVLAVVTPDWLASEWGRLEQEVATWMDPGSAQRRLVPLMLKDTQLPAMLARLRYIDCRRPDEFEQCLREVVATIREGHTLRARLAVDRDQREAVLSAPLLPWMGSAGPSFDFLWPEMFVDPPIQLRRHPGPPSRLSRWLSERDRSTSRNYVVLGAPGAGKSTALRSMLLHGGPRLPARRFLVHARELSSRHAELAARSREPNPDGVAILIDGLDEAGESLLDGVVALAARLSGPNTTIVLASRVDFFDLHFDRFRDADLQIYEILHMDEWEQADVLDFCDKYAERLGNAAIGQSVRRILAEVPSAAQIMRNPMRLTLVLFLLASGAAVDAISLREPYSLYRLFYDEWVRKEKQRRTTRLGFETLKRAHVALARWLYANRGMQGVPPGALEGLEPELPAMEELIRDSAFADLVLIDQSVDGEAHIKSFRHETIGESLIARDILESFTLGGEAVDHSLRLTVGNDVNLFVRSGMNELAPGSIATVLGNLTSRYYRHLSSGTAEGAAQIAESDQIREQILYYVGRLPLTTSPGLLREAYSSETSPLLRRSAALSAIVQGDTEIEAKYLDRLNDPEEDLLNRSVQLVYFGDVQADLHTHVDSGGDWSRVREAIYNRLQGTTIRDERLRWWDVRTLHSFYASRNFRDIPSPAQLEVLEQLARRLDGGSDRDAAIARELAALRDALSPATP